MGKLSIQAGRFRTPRYSRLQRRQQVNLYKLRIEPAGYGSDYHRWLLRYTLAHEIAHDVLNSDKEIGEVPEYQTLVLGNI